MLWNYLIKKYSLYLTILVFFGLITLKSTILQIPFSVISHFYIEKKYGFNNMTFKIFISDTIKSTLIEVII